MLQKLLERLLHRAAKLSGSLADSGAVPPAGAVDPAIESADRLIAEGNEHERAGNVQEACARYRLAVTAAPQYAKAHLNLGIGLQAGGDTDGAVRCYQRALAIAPGDPYAHYNAGSALYARGALGEAEEHLRKSLAAKADLAEARVALANVLDARGRAELAAEELEAALRARPGDFGALYNYGMLLARLDRRAEAEKPLRGALIVAPPDEPRTADARIQLCRIYTLQKNYGAAAAEVETVLRRWPERMDVRYDYAVLLQVQGRSADAQSELRRMMAADQALAPHDRERLEDCLARADVDEALRFYVEVRGPVGGATARWTRDGPEPV
jgi:tetratricopeptide (TPR) repeat protein